MDDIIIDPQIVRKQLNLNARKLDSLQFIFVELAKRMIARLDYIKLDPKKVLDCGSGLGYDGEFLNKKYNNAQIVELDCCIELLRLQQGVQQSYQQPLKSSWLKQIFKTKPEHNLVCGNAYQLPLANTSIDFCYANMLLPYLSDIPVFIKELRRILSLGGAFCISGLGVDSFKQLRELGLSTYRFPDMHDIGDMLLSAGFSNPVVDTEYLILEYDDLLTLLSDIRLVGCGLANDLRLRRALNKADAKKIHQQYKLPQSITLEIFVAHGWKDQHKIDLPSGQSAINFIPYPK